MTIPHKHECNCQRAEFKEWLPHIARDFLWFDIQDVGSYEGSVYGVALYKNKIAIYEDMYGSCPGCGAWGEGGLGEPQSQDEVIELSKMFDTVGSALHYINNKMCKFDEPDINDMTKAIHEVDDYRNMGNESRRI